MSRHTMCISHLKCLKMIAAISSFCGIVMATVSSTFIRNEDLDSSEVIDEEFSGDPMYETVWTQIFGILQILVSLWMVYAKGSKLSCQVWTLVHLFVEAFIGYYLWNLSQLINQTFYYQLFLTFMGINLCVTAFIVLVVIEIGIIHPTLPYESPEKISSSNLRKPI